MSQSDSNLEGETLGQFVVGNRLAAHPHLHWYNGSKVATGESFWLGVPIGDVDSDCPAGFTSIDGIVEGSKIWVRPSPLGAPISRSLQQGPLSIPSLICVLRHCAAHGVPSSIHDLWWEEADAHITYVGTTPQSLATTPSTLNLGKVIWHLATGQSFNDNATELNQLLPQPTPKEFVSSLQKLVSEKQSKRTTKSTVLSKKITTIADILEQSPVRSFGRQNTQELWEAHQGKHVSRAAGQPAFFIIGGLVTAAVVYLLAGLGFFPGSSANDDVPPKPPTKHQPINKPTTSGPSR